MQRLRYVHWKEDDFHIGYFEDYPDYLTQGRDEEELKANLVDLRKNMTSGGIPYIKKVDELVLGP